MRPSPGGRSKRAKATAEAEHAVIAIFHATTKPLSRSAGRSSVAAAAYRAGVKLEDHRTAMVFDFTRRSGVMAADIVAPDDAGEFASDRASLWNAAEQAEKRKDSRTAREWILALPAELDAEQRTNLARDFARELVKRYGVAADVVIHAPSRGGNDRNHHAHILCTTRVVSGDTLGEKSELELSDSKRKTLGLAPAADEISMLRERWAVLANAVLEKAGTAARIDHRSLAAQQADAFERDDLAEALALDREPQRHVGVHATQLDRRSGAAVSQRGMARERAVAAAHRAAHSAAKRSPLLIDAQRAAALELIRAEVGPVWGGNDPAPANDASAWVASDPHRAESDPVTAESTLHAAAGGSTWVDSDPHEESTMIRWPERPRLVADIENEIARLSRGLEARLDEAIPERRRAREAVSVAKWRDASVRNAQELIAMGEAETKHWDRQHRWQSLLDRVGIRQDSDRRTLLASLAERRAALEEARTQAALTKSEARSMVLAVQERERVERPAIEAAAAVEAAELPRLHVELEQAKAFEAAQEARLQERAHIQQTAQAETATVLLAPKAALNSERMAAFERGKVDRAGPEHAYQREFNAAARAGLIVWDNIAIRGTAAALVAGNSVADTRKALAACWPGDSAEVDELIHEGRAQRIVDRVREAMEAGAEPVTRAGAGLMSLVRDYGEDDKARAAVLVAFDASHEALAMDPAFRDAQESNRPAPRLS